MEYIARTLVFLCLSVVTVVVLCADQPEGDFKQTCRKCKPGYFAAMECNGNHDTVCSRCPEASFTSAQNLQDSCNSCSTCSDGYFVMVACSRTSDIVCESCLSIVRDAGLSSYQTRCLGVVMSDKNLLLPAPEHDDGLILPEADGSGESNLDVDVGAVSEPLDLESSENSENVSVIIKFEETEGSGEVELKIGAQEKPIEIETDVMSVLPTPENTVSDVIKQNITTQSTTTESEEEVVSDELLPLTNIVSVSMKSTTAIPVSTTQEPQKKDTFTTTSPEPEVVIGTTVGSIYLGGGIIVEPETDVHLPTKRPVDPTESYVYYPTERSRNKAGKIHRGYHVDNLLPGAEEKVGAQHTAAADDTADTVTVGVVVGVAISAAVVFFLLGFLASRFLRKRKSFKVMKVKTVEKTGPMNGGPPVVGIEYRDEERNDIYDEIDKRTDEVRSSTQPQSPVQEEIITNNVEDLYAVPDKKKRRNPESPILDHIDRIKFIDEITDDVFGTKDQDILENLDDSDSGADVGPSDTPPVDVEQQNGETTAEKDNTDEQDNEQEDETSPMLTNERREDKDPADEPWHDAED